MYISIIHLLILNIISCVNANVFGSPNIYSWNDKVDLLVNKVESDNTQLPYSYRDLNFVCPAVKPIGLSLGQIIQGDRLWVSMYDLKFGEDQACKTLCHFTASPKNVKNADKLIKDNYVVDWRIDDLIGATTFESSNHHNKYYAAGFPLGFVKDGISYLYNHVLIVLRYNVLKEDPSKYVIVGFEVYPKSVIDDTCPGSSKDFKNFALDISKKKDSSDQENTLIYYTYSVYWREDRSVDYSSRWDLYYEQDSNTKDKIHWFSIINSLVLLTFFTLVVNVLIMRVLKSELNKGSTDLPTFGSNLNSMSFASQLLTSRPSHSLLLSLFVSSGIQLLVISIWGILAFFLNSSIFMGSSTASVHTFFNTHQGAVFTMGVLFLVFTGFIPSYCGIVLHKTFNNVHLNTEYKRSRVTYLSIIFSGFLFVSLILVMLSLNTLLWIKGASTALPFGTIIVLFLLAFVQMALGIVGGQLGNRRKFDANFFLMNNGQTIDNEPKTYFQPKPKIWIYNPFLCVAAFGLIPFGVAYVEMSFIFNSVWLEKTIFYYMYGFLFLTAMILIIIICESAIIATYLALFVYKQRNWQWLCFQVGSSIGWYIFCYSAYYFVMYLNIRDFISIILYFSYMSIVCSLLIVGCGAVGVIAGLLFVKNIHNQTKLD